MDFYEAEKKRENDRLIIEATAKDYDMSFDEVESIFKKYYPDLFYEKLEEKLKEKRLMDY